MTRILPNGLMVPEDDILSEYLAQHGLNYDGIVDHDIIPVIKPGDWVMDIGAAVGGHTGPYLDAVGSEGKVISFEPNPVFFKCLEHNCPSARLFQGVVWADYEPLYLHVSKGNMGGSMVNGIPYSIGGEDVEGPLNVFVIDDIEPKRLDVVKMDMEGTEYFGLLGMQQTIKKHKPILFLEMNPGPAAAYNLTHMDVYDLLDEWGYKHHSVRNEPGDYCTSCDIIAYHEERRPEPQPS